MNDVKTPLSVKIGQDVKSPQTEITDTIRFAFSDGHTKQFQNIEQVREALDEWTAKKKESFNAQFTS